MLLKQLFGCAVLLVAFSQIVATQSVYADEETDGVPNINGPGIGATYNSEGNEGIFNINYLYGIYYLVSAQIRASAGFTFPDNQVRFAVGPGVGIAWLLFQLEYEGYTLGGQYFDSAYYSVNLIWPSKLAPEFFIGFRSNYRGREEGLAVGVTLYFNRDPDYEKPLSDLFK